MQILLTAVSCEVENKFKSGNDGISSLFVSFWRRIIGCSFISMKIGSVDVANKRNFTEPYVASGPYFVYEH